MSDAPNISARQMVLDACCGSRMFWFDPQDPRAVFMDNRKEFHVLNDASSSGGKRFLYINPDVVADFTKLPFPDERFPLVCFDPPHLTNCGPKSWLAKKYGKLPKDWQNMLAQGFQECFRVLKPHGVLIFKWNEAQIRISEVLALTPVRPLFGNRGGRTAKSHWIVFIKP